MGLLADFMAASEEQSLAYSGIPSDQIPKTHLRHMRRLTFIEMATLLESLGEERKTDITTNDWVNEKLVEFPIVKEEGGGEQLWTLISPKLVHALADAKLADLQAAALKWGKTDELNGWTNADMITVMSDLKSLFELAIAEKLPVYLWNSV